MGLNARCKEEDVVGGERSRAEIAKPQLCGTTEIHLYHGNLDTRRNVTIIIAGSARDVVWSFTLIDSFEGRCIWKMRFCVNNNHWPEQIFCGWQILK